MKPTSNPFSENESTVLSYQTNGKWKVGIYDGYCGDFYIFGTRQVGETPRKGQSSFFADSEADKY